MATKSYKTPFSKKLLIMDYIIAIALVVGYFVCVALNGIYAKNYIETMIISGVDMSMMPTPLLFNLDGFGILLSTWIIQLGVSSGAYYVLIKSDHKIELTTRYVDEMPQDIKDRVDMTQVITTVLSTTDN